MKFKLKSLYLFVILIAMFYDDNDEIEDARMDVIEKARRCNSGTKDEIQLYEQLSLALNLMQNDTFRVESSRICNGIHFNITTPYPEGLPVNVGSMFFNISTDYDVQIKEVPKFTYYKVNGNDVNPPETNFMVKIKKV